MLLFICYGIHTDVSIFLITYNRKLRKKPFFLFCHCFLNIFPIQYRYSQYVDFIDKELNAELCLPSKGTKISKLLLQVDNEFKTEIY